MLCLTDVKLYKFYCKKCCTNSAHFFFLVYKCCGIQSVQWHTVGFIRSAVNFCTVRISAVSTAQRNTITERLVWSTRNTEREAGSHAAGVLCGALFRITICKLLQHEVLKTARSSNVAVWSGASFFLTRVSTKNVGQKISCKKPIRETNL